MSRSTRRWRGAPGREVPRVAPVGRVKLHARELAPSTDLRGRRVMQLADAAHELPRLERVTVGHGDLPQVAGIVEARGSHLGVEAAVRQQTGGDRAFGGVRQQLGLPREPAAPVGLLREREAVEERRCVAGGAWVRVVAPRATERRSFLDDHEIVDAGALELHAHADAGVPGADDHDLCDSCQGFLSSVYLVDVRAAAERRHLPLDPRLPSAYVARGSIGLESRRRR